MQRSLCARWASLVLLLLSAFLCSAQTAAGPVIHKIDPPNWWPSLPDPMLLLYGSNLADAHFSVQGSGVTIAKSQTSDNGHYAFLWLTSANARPQTLRIRAANGAGSTSFAYELKPRASAQGRYQGFSAADAMYLIMTDRFADGDPSNNQPGYDPSAPRGWHGGDFRGIDQHLDYLQQLGITTVWLTPILSNGAMPQSYHGYAAVDLYAVDGHFGSLQEYLKLVQDLHARRMKIVFDSVPNHIGVEHPWVHDPPTPDWFHGTFEHHTHVQANFQELADPHAAPANALDITNGWFTDGMPDLNQENPLVSQYLIQNAIWWTETAGLDGLRIDTFPYVGRAFWSRFHQELHSIYPHLTTVGEVFNQDPTITSFFAGGATHEGIDTGLYTPFDFPSYFTLRNVLLHGEPMTALSSLLGEDHLYPHPERLVPFIGNHDTRRFLSEPGANPKLLKLAYAILTTMRGMPELYSGDEIAMQGGEDPDNRRDFPGGFPSSSHSAFTASARTPEEQDVFTWTSALLHLRASHPAITTGQQQDLFADATAIAYVRGNDLAHGCDSASSSDRLLIVASKASASRTIDLPVGETALANCTTFTPLFPPTAHEPRQHSGDLAVDVDEDGFAVYSVR